MVEKNVFFMTFSLSVIYDKREKLISLMVKMVGVEIETDTDTDIINGMK
jgi:hypothetical protein